MLKEYDSSVHELLLSGLTGDLSASMTDRLIYATDASAYREIPMLIVWPANTSDIRLLVNYARENNLSLIPRGAGTSLAGQVVGKGIVMDISKYMHNILEVNSEEKWVRVEPGVVLDGLNMAVRENGLFFAPETSTSNRCVIGGMIGNNSSGLHSLIYGTTREHLISVRTVLSDGSVAEFGELDEEEFHLKCRLNSLEGDIYRQINVLLSDPEKIKEIETEYPDPRIVRRNTGYALDEILDCSLFRKGNLKKFNFSKLIAGSEGTLAFITEAKLKLTPLPSSQKALVCVHFNSVPEAIRGNLLALEYKPAAVELMDRRILECTKDNIEQRKNRFFVRDNPGAILIIEFTGVSMEIILQQISIMEKVMRAQELGYHFPVITGADIKKVWNLRKAGLGVLSNIKGDAKPVSVIEDTSVHPSLLENYITELNKLLEKYQLDCVYHAHISVGELHLRPVLDLKSRKDVAIFRQIAEDTARLVKKYKGSLSGEHGDGRLRGEFMSVFYSEKIYSWFKELKNTWDPYNIFNPGKITDTPPMNTFLRYNPEQKLPEINTIFDFSDTGGILRAVEKCNGSGDCRKDKLMGGTMCPSYMALKDENTTTRARANIFREYITNSYGSNPFHHKEIFNILDLCLSCKGCKSECPSNVDMTKYKAEFLQHYYDSDKIPLRTRIIADIMLLNRIGSLIPQVFNFIASSRLISGLIKKILGFAKQRDLPLLSKTTLRQWALKNVFRLNAFLPVSAPEVYLFIDEFTNYHDVETGKKTILMLNKLGYRVLIRKHEWSARTYLSKGFLRKARKIAVRNVEIFSELVTKEAPLVGIEPSAILSFRDEYPDLVKADMKERAEKLAQNTFLIDEFLAKEMDAGRISKEIFSNKPLKIILHGHCHQKALASTESTKRILSFPENYCVEEIPSGCCGMAGGFGYEKEHYDLSMKIGELILFPEVRKSDTETIIAVPGTSCRQQIKDGTGRESKHPVEILYEALL